MSLAQWLGKLVTIHRLHVVSSQLFLTLTCDLSIKGCAKLQYSVSYSHLIDATIDIHICMIGHL